LVDEDQFRSTRDNLIDLPCRYEKAVLSRVCNCSLAERINIAEREAVACGSKTANAECKELLEATRAKANFALGLTSAPGVLTHASAMKIQCGGLLGLQAAVTGRTDQVPDIQELIKRSIVRYGAIRMFPFEEIMRSIVKYRHRSHVRRGN